MKVYPIHPLAAVMPAMNETDLAALRESIEKHGQREPAVILGGALLDGRHRQDVAQSLGVALIVRNYDPEKDGPSPAAFVADKNIARRHLTASQKAMAAQELLPFFQTEAEERQLAGKKAEKPQRAADAAGAAVGVSGKTVAAAAEVAAKDPELAKKVAAGQTTVTEAKKEIDSRPAEDPELTAIREGLDRDALTKDLGESFADAMITGTVLKTKEDINDFLTLNAPDQRRIKELIVRGWSTKKALKFMNREMEGKDPISDLFLRTLSCGTKKAKFEVRGWRITVERIPEKAAEGEAQS